MAGSSSKQKKKGRGKKKQRMADTADRHRLYELAVQCVEAEIDFVDETFKKLRKRKAKVLREDFCGTGNSSCEWVKRRKDNIAYGVDLDEEVLGWGEKNRVGRLKPDRRKRVHLVNGNVLTAKTPPADVVLAMNFSYWIFKTRQDMRSYFKSAYKHLKSDGIYFLDFYGGSDTMKEMREKRPIKGPGGLKFTYIWHQAELEPLSGHMRCYIHFAFPDKSKMNKAFSYDWRLWTMPEIRELLLEAGFRKVTVYLEGTEEDTGEGDGDFQPAEEGEADLAWIAYIVAEK